MIYGIEMLRDGPPDGIGNKSNLKDWADYAMGNSYMPDKAQLRHDLGTEGANAIMRPMTWKIGSNPRSKRKVGVGRRRRKMTTPTPARAAVSATNSGRRR